MISFPSALCETILAYIKTELVVARAKHEIKVKIAVALINEVPYVLGKYDFFKLFKISFQEYDDKVVMEKVI